MQVAVITGSNGLIGQATCRKLAQSGFLAVGIDIGAESKGNWPHYQCDLTDLDRMGETLASIEKDHGLIRVLYNNAGVFYPESDWLDVPRISTTTRWRQMSECRSSRRNGWQNASSPPVKADRSLPPPHGRG